MVNNFFLVFSLNLPFPEVIPLLPVILCTSLIISSASKAIYSSDVGNYHICNLPDLSIWFSLKPKPFYIVLGISEDHEVGENYIWIYFRVAVWSQSAFKWPKNCKWEGLPGIHIDIAFSAALLIKSIFFLQSCFCCFCFSTMPVRSLLSCFTG